MKTRYFKPSLLASAVLGAAALLGAAGTASASPTLQIVASPVAGGAPLLVHQEVTGDSGGTNWNTGGGTTSGIGVPSAQLGQGGAANWPVGGANGFANDSSFFNQKGTTGWHSSYLTLDKAGSVTFQYMGSGDASLINKFLVDFDGNATDDYVELFRAGSTKSCSGSPSVVPTCSTTSGGFAAGQNEYTFNLQAGAIKFAYMTGNGLLLENDGTGLGNPSITPGVSPGYFLGVDPYLASGTYKSSGSAVYAGLSDLPGGNVGGDHDFQDLGVRISVVPEPGGLALVLAAFGGLALTQRRSKRV